jgi:hypothetical protein
MTQIITNIEFVSHGEFSDKVTVRVHFGSGDDNSVILTEAYVIDHNMLEQAWDAYNAQVRAEDSYLDAPYSG